METGNICESFSIKSDISRNIVISGYASVFDIIDSQNDLIKQGAFAEADSYNIKLLWQHDVSKPIGIIKFIEEDKYGLKIEAEINNNISLGKEVTELIKQKAVSGLSIGFLTKDFEYDHQGIRLLKKVDLLEISIVTFPANKRAGITNIKAFNAISGALNKLENLVQILVNYK